jgi:EAL domain-containing protein (putative c-di-GMP-specific phosphodiesterase class I)
MQALELAKNEGLPFAMYFESRVQYSEQEVKIATDLRKAIINNDLFLYHQPQIVLEDFSVHGSEVLLRWDHPEFGFIPPNVFVKVAEDIGMIEDLTLWVIDCAFSQQSKLIKEGFEHKISINISGKDVNNQKFFQEVSRLLSKYGIDGKLVTLELTESVTVKDRLALKRLMAQFKEIDIQFSIDDFGTGFSSLEALSELNFNELKIDRSFVQDMVDSARNYTISSATIELANRLELDTVAEGVENEQVVSMLKGCFCKIGQGYYFSKPLPFDDYLNWLKNE